MKHQTRLLLFVAFFTFAFTGHLSAQKIDFVKDIMPIFKAKCYRCHGPDQKNGDFRIDDKDAASNYIEASDHEFSDLYLMVIGEGDYSQMPPPEEEDPLSVAEAAVIRAWINDGALWPDDVSWTAAPAEKKDEEKTELTFWPKLWKNVGVLHPALVHFPVALLTVAGLFSLLALRGSLVMSDIAYACLWLGAIGGLVASAVGWSYMAGKYPHDLLEFGTEGYWNEEWVWHAWGGIAASVFALILALIAAGYRRSDPEGGAVWKLGTILLAALVGIVGHFGGKLHYGSDIYDDLLKTIGVMEDKKPEDAQNQEGDKVPAGEKQQQDGAQENSDDANEENGIEKLEQKSAGDDDTNDQNLSEQKNSLDSDAGDKNNDDPEKTGCENDGS
jgi:uncharacterized membrane protein